MAAVTDLLKRYPVASFFVLAFGLAWIWGPTLHALTDGGRLALANVPPLAFLLLLLGEAASGVTGVILTYVVAGQEGLRDLFGQFRRWRVRVRWYVVALLTTAAAAALGVLLLAQVGTPDYLPPIVQTDAPALLLLIALGIGFPAGFTEEWGWTGYALPRLLRRYEAFTAALVLGLVWSAWHILLIFWAWPVPPTGTVLDPLAALLFLGALVPYRILLSWLYINTKRSLLLVIGMHICYDATLVLLIPASPRAHVLAYAGLNVVLWVFVAAVVKVYGRAMVVESSARRANQALEPAGDAPSH